MTPLLRKIDAETRRLESIGVRASWAVTRRARADAVAAIRTFRDPADAIRKGVARDSAMVELLTDAMVAAHLSGRRRTILHVGPRTIRPRLSTAYSGAIDFLARRLEAPRETVANLRITYGDRAVQIAADASNALAESVTRAVARTTAEGEGVRGGIKAIAEAFNRAGVTPGKTYQLEAIFRTQTQIAYSAGRASGWREPDIDDILWGFEYSAVLDDRTTDLCNSLNGVRKPKDDPFWSRFTPPNHWNCRSTAIEIFKDERLAVADETPAELEDPQDGFAFNPGDLYRDLIREAA
jgi:SPP1 gp7 family putative phage head morphogenesis protein